MYKVGLLQLPKEILLRHICNFLGRKDIISLQKTCKYLYNIIENDEIIWKKILFELQNCNQFKTALKFTILLNNENEELFEKLEEETYQRQKENKFRKRLETELEEFRLRADAEETALINKIKFLENELHWITERNFKENLQLKNNLEKTFQTFQAILKEKDEKIKKNKEEILLIQKKLEEKEREFKIIERKNNVFKLLYFLFDIF